MFTYYSFRNIYAYISEYFFQNNYMLIGKYILVIFRSLLSWEILWVHAHLSKCWKVAWPEEVWKHLSKT